MIPEFETRQDVENISQRHTLAQRVAPGLVRCRVLGGPTLIVHDDDKSIAGWLITAGYWESWLTLPISKFLKPGMYAVDVGASYGYFTALMAERVGPTGRVLAVEAHPEVYDLVRRSVLENGWEHAWVRHFAAGAVRGEVTLWQEPGNTGGSSVKWDEEPGRRSFKVEQVPLDEVLGEPVDFIKIDVEGAEFDVLKGLQETIRRSPRFTAIIEVAVDRGYDAREVWRWCEEQGLRVQAADHSGWIGDFTFDEVFPADAPKGSLGSLWLSKREAS